MRSRKSLLRVTTSQWSCFLSRSSSVSSILFAEGFDFVVAPNSIDSVNNRPSTRLGKEI
jgi:hypothetical protein